jgi:rubrerythrin
MYRCRICGETHLGSERPSHCPFCGAHAEFIVDTTDYPEHINDVQVTEVERDDLLQAIELERGNTRFYLGMGDLKADNPKLASAYKRLGRVEAEHCSLFCKLAGVTKPADLTDPDQVSADWCANIEESLAREQRASRFYAEASTRTTNERIKEVFAAVSEVEADHIELDHLAQRIAGC